MADGDPVTPVRAPGRLRTAHPGARAPAGVYSRTGVVGALSPDDQLVILRAEDGRTWLVVQNGRSIQQVSGNPVPEGYTRELHGEPSSFLLGPITSPRDRRHSVRTLVRLAPLIVAQFDDVEFARFNEWAHEHGPPATDTTLTPHENNASAILAYHDWKNGGESSSDDDSSGLWDDVPSPRRAPVTPAGVTDRTARNAPFIPPPGVRPGGAVAAPAAATPRHDPRVFHGGANDSPFPHESSPFQFGTPLDYGLPAAAAPPAAAPAPWHSRGMRPEGGGAMDTPVPPPVAADDVPALIPVVDRRPAIAPYGVFPRRRRDQRERPPPGPFKPARIMPSKNWKGGGHWNP